MIYQDPDAVHRAGVCCYGCKVYGDDCDKPGRNWRRKRSRSPKAGSEAYGLFLKGESDLVLSYTTSPAYHILEEKKDNYAAANFSEGHYLQVEVAARTAASKQPELAKIPPVYGFSGFPECDPNRQLDVSGGKRHAACRFES
ncbi:thiamine ABC transporter substrate-binding protein [Escherichia coli]